MNPMKLVTSMAPLASLWVATSLFSGMAIAPRAMAQTPATIHSEMARVLTVRGTAKVEIPTSITVITLGVELEGKTAAETQEKMAAASSQVVAYLQGQNVDKLQTTGIRLQPQYRYADNVRRLVGYEGNNTVSFEVPTEQAGTIMDQAVQQGATRINNIFFKASEAETEAAQQEALQQATLDAQRQAQAVLSTLNLSSREIIKIEIDGATVTPPPVMQMDVMRAMPASAEASTPVVGGDETVRANVTLMIRY